MLERGGGGNKQREEARPCNKGRKNREKKYASNRSTVAHRHTFAQQQNQHTKTEGQSNQCKTKKKDNPRVKMELGYCARGKTRLGNHVYNDDKELGESKERR